MKKLILAGAASLLMSGAAVATDAPTAAEPMASGPGVTYDWTGSYVALFAGGGWGDVDVHDVNGYQGAPPVGDFSYDADGFYGGVLGGYNWQNGSWVFGIEGELGYLGLDDSAQYPPYVGVRLPTDSRSSIESDFFASLTGRIGLAAGNMLFYLKGGGAGLNTDVSFIDTDPTGLTLVSGTSASDFMVGWTAGGGLEVMLNNGWIARGEYMYMDLGDINVAATDSGATLRNFNHEVVVHTVKVAVGKKF
ncbi:MAG: outer membrane beta-barrel protein [Hyphomicrobiales bacterium]|nr:outer membrane beta-barrel protein [Hyphomicrobiales bacterium]